MLKTRKIGRIFSLTCDYTGNMFRVSKHPKGHYSLSINLVSVMTFLTLEDAIDFCNKYNNKDYQL